MFAIFTALFPVFVILMTSEFLWNHKLVKGERARKFIHILAGIWIAFWPFYIPFDGIFILGTVALTLLVYSRFTKLFHAIYAVKRKTYGEIFYALAIIFCSYFGTTDWIFTTSILLLSLADGGAAVVGRFWGLKNQYFVFGWPVLCKSVIGTMSYVVFAYICIGVGWLLGGQHVMSENFFTALIVLPIVSTLLENVTPYGMDNLITPVFATLVLNSLI
jgi:dolichol kinase